MVCTKKTVNWFLIGSIVSLGLIGAGIGLLVSLFGPVATAEIRYQFRKSTTPEIVPIDTQLGMVIPKIGANARIVPNVDPYDSRIYQRALTQGVAHAKGSVLPGDVGVSFLFSHSSANLLEAQTYNSVFYLLHHLVPGDMVVIYRDGQSLSFQVTKKQVVSAAEITYLSQSSDHPQVILMTCWPPGTDLQRLLITADLLQPRN